MNEFIKQLFGGCKHIELTLVQKDGFQYCEDCGQAFLAPRYDKCKCIWKTIKEYSTTNRLYGNVVSFTYVQKCIHCGEIKKIEV